MTQINVNQRESIDGVLLLDKALGISSNKALQQIKHLFKAEKAGHTGSLDPLATGMLPICLGQATKYSQYLLNANKKYYVVGQLGTTTTTGDSEGAVLRQRPVPTLTDALLAKVLSSFTGAILQTPPMFSALKHQGQPLYKFARKGICIERKARLIHIDDLKLINYKNDSITLEVSCSKGTYIRTLIEDIGEQLQCGAHTSLLRRLSVASYTPEQMKTYSELSDQKTANTLKRALLPIDSLLEAFPRLALEQQQAIKIINGQRLPLPNPDGLYKLYYQETFLGLGYNEQGTLRPERLMSSHNVVI